LKIELCQNLEYKCQKIQIHKAGKEKYIDFLVIISETMVFISQMVANIFHIFELLKNLFSAKYLNSILIFIIALIARFLQKIRCLFKTLKKQQTEESSSG
jgi:hypothetical protein